MEELDSIRKICWRKIYERRDCRRKVILSVACKLVAGNKVKYSSAEKFQRGKFCSVHETTNSTQNVTSSIVC